MSLKNEFNDYIITVSFTNAMNTEFELVLIIDQIKKKKYCYHYYGRGWANAKPRIDLIIKLVSQSLSNSILLQSINSNYQKKQSR